MRPFPIIIVDDDHDDIELMQQVLEHLQFDSDVIIFDDSTKALAYLQTLQVQPLFILCDVNMHLLDGINLRKALFENEEHKLKTIPFLFLSTSDAPPHIRHAYALCAQGYFIKPNNFDELVELLRAIITYWQLCRHPIV